MVIHNLCCSFNSAECIALTELRQSEYNRWTCSTYYKNEKFLCNFTNKPRLEGWYVAKGNCFECILNSNTSYIELIFFNVSGKSPFQGKEWIHLTHSRIQWHIYKHNNEFTASVKDENILTSWVMCNFSLAPQNSIKYTYPLQCCTSQFVRISIMTISWNYHLHKFKWGVIIMYSP